MRRLLDFEEELEQFRVDLQDAPQRVVDADPAPLPTYAKPAPPHRAAQWPLGLAWLGLALLVLVGGGVWALLSLQAGFWGWLMGLVVIGPLLVAAVLVVTSTETHSIR
jgi:hypothetical protein